MVGLELREVEDELGAVVMEVELIVLMRQGTDYSMSIGITDEGDLEEVDQPTTSGYLESLPDSSTKTPIVSLISGQI